ncbi:MAG: TIM barrel protein [Oscillospiraceae bacterium]|nr:TIM barrel protein [Oscillospiraceae bacterium]
MSNLTMQDIAVMSVSFVQHTFPFYLNSMAKCGLKNIDMWGGAPHYCRLDYATSGAAAAKIRELRSQMADQGMQVVIYTPETLGYPMSYSAPDPALRDRTVDYMKYAMEDALAFGTNRVFLNTGCHPRDLPREEGWKRTADSYRRLCDVAEKWGIQLVLEQLQPYESNLVLNLADIKRMLQEVDSPALCCCVDLVAMEVAGDTLEDFCKDLGDKLQWVHYSDSHHLILGDGDYGREKLEGWVRTLEKYQYQNCIDLEINDSIYWEDPHTSVQRSAAYLREFLPER